MPWTYLCCCGVGRPGGRGLFRCLQKTFHAFSNKHPWVGEEGIQPKAVAAEMFENFMSFNDYIKAYGLQRSEGVLLRHISGVFKVLLQA